MEIYNWQRFCEGEIFDKSKEEKKLQNHKVKTLFIIDVQKSFKKWFSENYVHRLKQYCQLFEEVYYIFDNHVDGKNPEQEYLYDPDHSRDGHRDLYDFPNVKELIEKRYNYDVDVSHFQKVLSPDVYEKILSLENKKKLRRGDYFPTTEGTILVYIGNNHKWFHCPKKLYEVLQKNLGKRVVIVGGADGECLIDIVTTARTLGVGVLKDNKYIYSGSWYPM